MLPDTKFIYAGVVILSQVTDVTDRRRVIGVTTLCGHHNILRTASCTMKYPRVAVSYDNAMHIVAIYWSIDLRLQTRDVKRIRTLPNEPNKSPVKLNNRITEPKSSYFKTLRTRTDYIRFLPKFIVLQVS
jgi:hypothetical protein